jgi:hypothetical protein
VPVLIPDVFSETAEMLLGVGGSRFLDAAFLAVETGAILLSDDMRYREVSAAAVGCHGVWLQAALLAALEAKEITAADYGRAVVGLAGHAHDHIVLNGPLLYLIARQDEDGFPGLRAALRLFGGPKAEMRSHRTVFYDFLSLLWPPNDVLPWLRTGAATGLSLEIFLGNRKNDWVPLLNEIIRFSKHDYDLADYVASWVRGHFITKEDLTVAAAPETRTRQRRKRAA